MGENIGVAPFLLLMLAAELTIGAASDLSPLEAALKQAWGPGLRFSFGSSGALLRQIENGAPYDVFLSANELYIDEGIRKGVLQGPARLYAIGHVALWSKGGTIRTLDQLRDRRILHISIANPAYAPYGAAARQVLERAGLWRDVESRIVYGENVRQALQYAESGNADVALVSWSLVHDRGGILIPGADVRQAAAAVRITPETTRFLDWLTGPKGQAVLSSHGLR